MFVIAGIEIPLERAALGVAIWASLMAIIRAIVLTRVAHRTMPPIVGALALGLVMALPPWIFIATGAVRPVFGAALLLSLPAGLVMTVGSFGFLNSLRKSNSNADE